MLAQIVAGGAHEIAHVLDEENVDGVEIPVGKGLDRSWFADRQVSVILIPMKPRETLEAFDVFLEERGLRLDAVVIGGAALNLLGVVARLTKDCDILCPQIPDDIGKAAKEFAAARRLAGEVIADDWLNNGPASLVPQLAADWRDHLRIVFSGRALRLECPGRDDFLRSKLFALCDRGLDLGDCLALAPTREELTNLLPWLDQQDGNPGWPAHVHDTLSDLGRRLGHGV